MRDYQSKTREELKQFAMDVYDCKIFTHAQLRNQYDLRSVFMPIALGCLNDWTEEEIAEVGFIYEYMSEAGPRSVNGYPCFTSVKFMDKTDSQIAVDFYNEYKNLKEGFAKS